jgi:hypothetical protein
VYRTLQAALIVETADRLALRVGERFPGAGLSRVAKELAEVAARAEERCEEVRRPHVPYRVLAGILGAAGLATLGFLLTNLKVTGEEWHLSLFFSELNDFLGSTFFLGAGVVFLFSMERRWKREKVLAAVGELRAIAHVVDMHQLTKDPESVLHLGPGTPASPKRSMTAFELGRYYDYCSEMLSVASKVGALYIQALPDPVALEAVDDLEELCTGLSRKIWQKAMILDRYAGAGRPGRDAVVNPIPGTPEDPGASKR